LPSVFFGSALTIRSASCTYSLGGTRVPSGIHVSE